MVMQIAAGIFIGFLMIAVFAIIVFAVSAYISKLSDYKFLPDKDDINNDDEWFTKDTINKIRAHGKKEPPLVTEKPAQPKRVVKKTRPVEQTKTKKRYDFDA